MQRLTQNKDKQTVFEYKYVCLNYTNGLIGAAIIAITNITKKIVNLLFLIQTFLRLN